MLWFQQCSATLAEDHASLLHCRGIGGSTIFKHFWEYSTGALAADALALLEHLGWERTHLVGMSLGGAEQNNTSSRRYKSPRSLHVARFLTISMGTEAIDILRMTRR